ncbi:MAG: phage portal protein [Propionibacterium sp.]|nr:phage portal protein [Propionibacterium sp.]
MSLFRREQRQWAPEPIISPFPGVSPIGSNGTPSADSAMRSSAVWACVRLLADTVSMMPLHAYTLREGVRVPIADPPLLLRPSDDATMPDWIYMVMVSALLRGNVYGRVVRRDAQQYPVQIELMNPDDVQVRVDASGALTYATRGGTIPREDVWHMKAYRMPGLRVGLSPIQYAAASINMDAAINAFALGYFLDAPHPSSVLESDQSINQEQARTIKERLIASVNGREPLILGAGLKFNPLSVSPEESQFLATQKFGIASIARIFGVPPEMIAAEAGNSMTYANVEQRGIDFLTYSVQAWLTRIEASLAPLMPGQKHARFDTSVLTRTDIETRIKAGAIAIASKQQTPDEVRAWSDLPPLTDEQKKWLEIVPLTVSPTGLPKALPVAPAADTATEGEPA